MMQSDVRLFPSLVFALTLAACGDEQAESAADTEAADEAAVVEETSPGPEAPPSRDTAAQRPTTGQGTAPADEAMAEAADAQVIDVVTTEYAIEMPETMKLGWNTFRFSNEGNQTHFVILYRLVEGKTIEDQKREVVPAFDAVMEGLRNGDLTKEDIGPFLGENIPEWGLQMTYVGGAGLLAPGETTQATFKLETPGTHLAECYVKAPDGTWHTSMGMLTQVTVLNETGGAKEPAADFEVSIGNDSVTAPETVPAGTHTIQVAMLDDPETFMPYDLNLARIDDDTNLDDVVFWMDWSNVGGLRAPAPVEFLGGVEHMKGGNHGYMTVDLTPGKYLWISEINASQMNQTFVVE